MLPTKSESIMSSVGSSDYFVMAVAISREDVSQNMYTTRADDNSTTISNKINILAAVTHTYVCILPRLRRESKAGGEQSLFKFVDHDFEVLVRLCSDIQVVSVAEQRKIVTGNVKPQAPIKPI